MGYEQVMYETGIVTDRGPQLENSTFLTDTYIPLTVQDSD